MLKRSFGGDAHVSVLAIGCGRVGSISNAVPMREIAATLEAAIEAGINLFDTADIYGQGDSERTLGRLLRRHHDRMFVITKVGGRHSRYAGIARFAKPLLKAVARSRPQARNAVVAARTATVVHEFSPSDLRPAVEASRRRLGLDQLHGLLLHSPSTATLLNPQIHDFLDELLATGKAGQVGVSVDSFAALEAAVSIPAVTMIQAPLEIAQALPGTRILDSIRERRIGIFVREVLRRHEGKTGGPSPREALSEALAPDFVTSAILGVSTRSHLNALLPSAII